MSVARTTPQDGVVLLHGISRTSRSFRKMEIAIGRAGYTTLNIDYASRRNSLQELVEEIHPAIELFAEALDGSVHFVCHSMGGLLARAYLARHRPQNLGRVVMLGTPNGGSEIADRLKNTFLYRAVFGPAGQQLGTHRDAATMALLPPVDYPVGIVAGDRSIYPVTGALLPRPHDGRVSVANTRLDGMADHVVVHASHPWLVRSDAAISATLSFLRDGRFTSTRP
ncbi:triacylglycerol lipase [Bradyrhizobium liaoningense]|uniref:esterase/lipase family protein n=1 Tax=Bradyrhizobium liaoningense TaxID=43992 RepID=UPI001BA9D43E|nr:alpha/beta fold hydrolase [Bradyrhizobium liaoningense]MBR0715154.1 alpha/beta fold hydrolase [Bradyrhizobium liaoningense]